MASRQNRESREDVPSYGAPMGPTPVNTKRDKERQTKLEKEATPEERRRLIEEHESRGQEETAERRRNLRTETPKPTPYERVGETTGKTPARIIAERPGDVSDAIDRAEGVEPTREPAAAETETPPERPLRTVRPPKQ